MVRVSKTVKRFTRSQVPQVTDRFREFTVLLEELYGVQLPRPLPGSSTCNLKQFCSGLVEGDLSHPWRDSLRNLSAQCRFGFAHSLFLFRKVIPGEKPHLRQYVEKLSLAQAPPEPSFKAFALRMVRQLFPFGWDKSYQEHCLRSSLPMTACAEVGRRGGGCRGLEVAERMRRSEFCTYVMQSVAPRARGVSRVETVASGGKWRIISIPPRIDNALRPLHKALYSHLSRTDWLLRGDAKAARFKDFTPVQGEIFVSGDYESATDNLNADLQQSILSELLRRSWTIPQGIRDHAISIYESDLLVDGDVFRQRRGQLMGQLTSFPLLCLINYITFRYSIPRTSVPVRINGDDIVFRATPNEVDSWERNVAKGGLTLSKGKTLMHSRAFTLNSTPFWSCSGGARQVGFVRSSAIWKDQDIVERVVSLNSRFYSCSTGFGRSRTELVRSLFLLQNQSAILACRRSLTRGMGCKVGRGMLHDVGLWHRELFYLEQVEERPLPVLKDGGIPAGFKSVPEATLGPDELARARLLWGEACVDHAWTASFSLSELSSEDKLRRLFLGTSPYGISSVLSPIVKRMLNLTRSKAWKWVYSRENESVFGRVRMSRSKGVFVPVDAPEFSRRVIFFKAGGVQL